MKSLLDQLPSIVAEGKREAERVMERAESNYRLGLQTRELVIPSKDSNWKDLFRERSKQEPNRDKDFNKLGRRLISAQPQSHRGELDHGEEVLGQLVVTGGDTAEVLQLGEEALDEVPLAIEPRAEVGFPAPIRLGRDIGERSLIPERRPDVIGIICFVCQHDCSGANVVE